MINWQNGVTPINESNMNKLLQNDVTTIWQGTYYTTGSTNTQYFTKTLENGRIYIFYCKGLSSQFVQVIPFVCGISNSIQQSYYDGTANVRWRIVINSTRTGFYLDDSSQNMGENTAVIRCVEL